MATNSWDFFGIRGFTKSQIGRAACGAKYNKSMELINIQEFLLVQISKLIVPPTIEYYQIIDSKREMSVQGWNKVSQNWGTSWTQMLTNVKIRNL